MKAAPILAFFALQAAACGALAAGPNVNREAAAEARTFLIPCARYSGPEASMCAQNTYEFVEYYVIARSGDVGAMDQIASYFGTYPSNPAVVHSPGIINDRVQGCAWLQARVHLHPDRSTGVVLKSACGDLGPVQADRALDRAEQIVHQIQIAPTRPPPLRPIAHPECLDSQVCSLGEDCKPFVPPPGCPHR